MWFVLACAAAVVAVAAPAALSDSSASRMSIASLESGLLQQLNSVRADHGLVALRSNPKLTAAADQHSREMADDGYFDHNSFDGTSFSDRIAKWYPARELPQLDGRREPALVVAERRSSGRSRDVDAVAWAPREHPQSALARDRHRRDPQHLGRRRLHPSAGHDHHDRLRRSPLAAVPFPPGARSSVEERRPSKPLVGGSNPPGRTWVCRRVRPTNFFWLRQKGLAQR